MDYLGWASTNDNGFLSTDLLDLGTDGLVLVIIIPVIIIPVIIIPVIIIPVIISGLFLEEAWVS